MALARGVVHRASDYGQRHGLEWLEYSPVTMLRYHQLALSDAPSLVGAIERCFPQADSLVDVGAGSGAISAEWRRRGHRIAACERNSFGRLIARTQGVRPRPFSLAETPPADLSGPFDLAVCLEVAEHVPAEFAPRLVEFLAGLAPTIIFSAAPPGHGGHSHINEQPPSYWDALYAKHGVKPDEERSEALRSAFVDAGVQGEWYIHNTRVLGR